MISVLLALSLLGISLPNATSQPMSPVCPAAMETAQNFDMNEFSGRWYVQAKYFTATLEYGKCITVDYLPNGDGTTTISMKGFDYQFQKPRSLSAVARIPGEADASKWKISFPSLKTIPESDYWIVETDNENYGIAFACKQLSPYENRIRSWILTRERNPSQEVMDAAVRAAHSHGISTSSYELVDQTDC